VILALLGVILFWIVDRIEKLVIPGMSASART